MSAGTPRLLCAGASVTVHLLGDGHVLRVLHRVADDPAADRTEAIADGTRFFVEATGLRELGPGQA